MRPDFPFDAVVFDLDGTLVATDLFWPEAARIGAQRAFDELGLRRALPTRADWMAMVGLPIDHAFEQAFQDLAPEQRRVVLERCLEEEQRVLRAGRAALLPGAREVLEHLSSLGVRLGIASNCGREYLAGMMDGLGLARWIEEARCLDSPGIRTKSDMVRDLLSNFGTRSAVMVGDRSSDRDAGWSNGLPHVHFDRGYGGLEEVECEAKLDGLEELVPRLEGRRAWLESIARLTDLARARVVGLAGLPGSDAELFGRDLAWVGSASGAAVEVLGAAEFAARPAAPRGAAGAVVIGPEVVRPELRERLDVICRLEVFEQVRQRRIHGEFSLGRGPAAAEAHEERVTLPARALLEAHPVEPGDLIVDTSNALGPPPAP